MPTSAPPFLIETERLRIRAWRPADRPAFAAMATDPELMRFITGGVPMSAAQVDAGLARQAAHMREVGFCMGAAELRATGEIIGVIGLQPVDRDDAIDIGWWVRREHQRQGLAREAATGLCAFMQQHYPGTPISASIHPDNVASQGVARSIGLVASGPPVPASSVASWREDIPVLVFRSAPAAAPAQADSDSTRAAPSA